MATLSALPAARTALGRHSSTAPTSSWIAASCISSTTASPPDEARTADLLLVADALESAGSRRSC